MPRRRRRVRRRRGRQHGQYGTGEGGGPTTPTDGGANERATISLSASGKVEASPDQATVRVTVSTVAKRPEDARNRVAKNVTNLLERLRAAGIGEKQIRTKGFGVEQIEPDGVPDHEEDHDYPSPAYRARHRIQVEVDST